MNEVAETQARPLSERLSTVEQKLCSTDRVLAGVIRCFPQRWPVRPTENVIWGLLRIVMAQQVSTVVACRLAERAKSSHPSLLLPTPEIVLEASSLRAIGLSQRRAECCVEIVRRSEEILGVVAQGQSWELALKGIKGIGPWTIAVFRIMVLREPDVLPLGDVGLERAVANIYGPGQDVEKLSENWRPFRSVACWYLWRTLGNLQLG
jgi:DNA-3-methyladenine glycosylase II